MRTDRWQEAWRERGEYVQQQKRTSQHERTQQRLAQQSCQLCAHGGSAAHSGLGARRPNWPQACCSSCSHSSLEGTLSASSTGWLTSRKTLCLTRG